MVISWRRPGWLIAAASLWLASVGNIALWREMASLGLLERPRHVAFGIALMLMIAAVLALLMSLFAWRLTLKPVIVGLLVAAALGAHFMFSYGIVIDASMITNLLQTDVKEARDLLDLRLLGALLLGAGVPAWVVWRWPLQTYPWARQAGHNALLLIGAIAVLLVVGMLSFQSLATTVREHKPLRYLVNPLNSIYALAHVLGPSRAKSNAPLQPIGRDATLGPSYRAPAKPPLLILVLGETARSGNFSINGYERDTTPELAAARIASFRNAWSCGTSTAASVPCMFSHLTKDAFEARGNEFEGLLDVAAHAGLAVLWVDNQSGCKGVCARVPSVEARGRDDASICPDGECLDEVMLKQLDAQLNALPAEKRARGTLVVLHQMGSHGPAYTRRSPDAFKRFQPECASTSLLDCRRESVVNAYDNSIAYTDHFLATTIHWLEARRAQSDTAMVYVSDHGESLGENNLYLHGLPYAVAPDVQKRVPWITWLSPEYEVRRRVGTDCLKGRADQRVSHDNYFHSVLGLLDVQTAVYVPALDVYAGCVAR